MSNQILKMEGIRKAFNGVEVLHSVNFSLEKGSVAALVGENGAGKSTLMKILMGEHTPDAGKIFIDGEEVVLLNPHQARERGVSMIFQEMSAFPDMSVANNIYIGREPTKYGFVDANAMRRNAQQLLDSYDIKIHADAIVKNLSVAETQLLEIAKAVSYDAKIVVMDEPTSALTDNEVGILFEIIGKLKSRGVGIIYITHKLDELPLIADTVSVLRDGMIISSRSMKDFDQQTVIGEMVGRSLDNVYPVIEKEIGETLFEAEHLCREGVLDDISFKVARGEILGFAGMVGAGRTETIEALFGIERLTSGKIIFRGKELDIKTPGDAVAHHFALVPEDRAHCGLNLRGSVLSNICVTIIDKLSRCGFAARGRERASTGAIIEKMRIKIHSVDQRVASLSGGNQQKIVVAKWLLTEPELVFLDEPTRGIDVGAKYEIYELIQALAKAGKAVIVVSSEMPELLGICDRLIVLKQGRIVSEMQVADATQEKIMTAIVNG